MGAPVGRTSRMCGHSQVTALVLSYAVPALQIIAAIYVGAVLIDLARGWRLAILDLIDEMDDRP